MTDIYQSIGVVGKYLSFIFFLFLYNKLLKLAFEKAYDLTLILDYFGN